MVDDYLHHEERSIGSNQNPTKQNMKGDKYHVNKQRSSSSMKLTDGILESILFDDKIKQNIITHLQQSWQITDANEKKDVDDVTRDINDDDSISTNATTHLIYSSHEQIYTIKINSSNDDDTTSTSVEGIELTTEEVVNDVIEEYNSVNSSNSGVSTIMYPHTNDDITTTTKKNESSNKNETI